MNLVFRQFENTDILEMESIYNVESSYTERTESALVPVTLLASFDPFVERYSLK